MIRVCGSFCVEQWAPLTLALFPCMSCDVTIAHVGNIPQPVELPVVVVLPAVSPEGDPLELPWHSSRFRHAI